MLCNDEDFGQTICEETDSMLELRHASLLEPLIAMCNQRGYVIDVTESTITLMIPRTELGRYVPGPYMVQTATYIEASATFNIELLTETPVNDVLSDIDAFPSEYYTRIARLNLQSEMRETHSIVHYATDKDDLAALVAFVRAL
jgi:hypothetical protein